MTPSATAVRTFLVLDPGGQFHHKAGTFVDQDPDGSVTLRLEGKNGRFLMTFESECVVEEIE